METFVLTTKCMHMCTRKNTYVGWGGGKEREGRTNKEDSTNNTGKTYKLEEHVITLMSTSQVCSC